MAFRAWRVRVQASTRPSRVGTAGTIVSAIIALESIGKVFSNAARPALTGVSLQVQPREFIAIVGGSGSGKTTLLRLINRLIEPDAGVILVSGEDVLTLDPIALRRRIGYVFQGVGLFPHMSVAENIAITPRLLGWDARKRRERADELLRLVRLDPAAYRTRLPHELSGGERQRVGVARALGAQPSIVLMDEPFGALDPLTREALSADYRRMHNDLGLTTLMITHDALEAVLLADRIAVLREGQLVAQGTPAEMMASQPDDHVRELMDTPRRHAERLNALLARNGA
jgi:osmoprotectant transport system ATP-binding protein